jgi:hypothetical protein
MGGEGSGHIRRVMAGLVPTIHDLPCG